MIQVRANYPRWQLEAVAIYSAGGAEVGAGLGCGKARYGTVARFHVFQGGREMATPLGFPEGRGDAARARGAAWP